jgi:hypothetical protein
MSTIIISVGTSLLNNLLDKSVEIQAIFNNMKIDQLLIKKLIEGLMGLSDSQKADFIQQILGAEDLRQIQVRHPLASSIKIFCSDIDSYLDYVEKKMLHNIRKREEKGKKGGRDLLPAEISSLFLYFYSLAGELKEEFKDSDQKKDDIIFLCTDTADSVFCASILVEIITKNSWFNSKISLMVKTEENQLDVCGIKHIPKLNVYSPEEWVGTEIDKDQSYGLANIYNWFKTLENNKIIEPGDVIIRTGGYKELSADLKLIAFQVRLKSLYLFDDSTTFIQTFTDGWPQDFEIVALKTTRLP